VTETPDLLPERIELDLNDYPILISPSLYEFFLANRKMGLESLLLYIHLQYTARRQKTNQVWANDTYLVKGLGFGIRKMKVLKAFLKSSGLIEYIQSRADRGRMMKTYIRLPYIHQRDTVEKLTGGTVFDPPVTGGTFTAPPVDRTTRPNKQMLKVNKEMLKVKKERGDKPLSAPYDLVAAWEEGYRKKMGKSPITGKKEFGQAKTLLKKIDLEDAKQRLSWFFADSHWFTDNSNFTFGCFISHINELVPPEKKSDEQAAAALFGRQG